MSGRTRIASPADSSEASSELVPVVERGATVLQLSSVDDLPDDGALPVDLLSEALFGEVIDISDLVAFALASAEPTFAKTDTEASAGLGLADRDFLSVPSQESALIIIYDDGLLASDGTIL